MNVQKRLIAMLMAVSVLLAMPVFALEFPDVPNTHNNYEAINVLSSLGIIKGYENGQYLPDQTVTRAEMTSLLMRLQNISITGIAVAESGYADVANDYWAVYDIKTASGMGIIVGYGDGNFGPESPVTFEQAVKMLVAMLGYNPQATSESYGGWPDGYMRVAREKGILKKAEMTQTDPAPRGVIAQILYNALTVDLMDTSSAGVGNVLSGQTVLTNYLKIERIEGKVVANSATRFDSNQASTLQADEVQIKYNNSTRTFKVGNCADVKDMLGLDIVTFAKYDENNVNSILQFVMTKGVVTETVINARDIIDVTQSGVTYEKNDREYTESFGGDASTIYIYNGKFMDKASLFSYQKDGKPLAHPIVGDIVFTNSGNGNNLVKINSYDTYVVRNASSSGNDSVITVELGKDALNVPLYDEFNWMVSIKKNNADATFSNIAKGNILSVRVSHTSQQGLKLMDILVSDTKKTGKIDESDGEKFKISGTEYRMSPSLRGVTDIEPKLVFGANGTFYIDSFGDVAYADFTESASLSYGYAIKVAASTDSLSDTSGSIRILTSNGKVETYDFANSVTVDGNRQVPSDIVSYFEDIAQNDGRINRDLANKSQLQSQPIKYSINSSKKVTEIVTISKSDPDLVPKSGFVFESDGYDYDNTNNYFHKGGTTIAMDSNTLIFSIPADRQDTAKYGVKSRSYFAKSQYVIEVVGVTSTGTAKIILLYDSNQDEDVHYNSPQVLVTSIKLKNNPQNDNQSMTEIVGYDFRTGSEVTKWARNTSDVSRVGVGDIIRFGLDVEGYINENVYIYLDASNQSEGVSPNVAHDVDTCKSPNNYPLQAVFLSETLKGNVYYDPSTISITNLTGEMHSYIYATPESKILDNDQFTITDGTDSKPLTIGSSAKMFVYDKYKGENDRIKYLSAENDRDLAFDQLITKEDRDTNHDMVFVYVYNNTVRSIYIIKM